MYLRRAIEDSVQVIQSTRQDQQIHVREVCLSLDIHYRHVSTAVTVTITLIHNITISSYNESQRDALFLKFI